MRAVLSPASIASGLRGAKRGQLFQTAEQVREQLFFPRNDSGEFPDVRLFLRGVERGEELGSALDEEERGLVVDVGDEEGGEEEAGAGAGDFEGGEECVLFLRKVREGQLFDLRDGEAVAGLLVGFAIGAPLLYITRIVSTSDVSLQNV